MAADLTPIEIRKILRNEFAANLNKFELLRAISDLVNINRNVGQEFILRVL